MKLVTIYIFWTLVYSAYSIYNNSLELNIIDVITNGINKSYYHLWFIPMLIGVYVCIPLLKPIVNSGKKTIEYFLIIFLLLKIIPTTITLFKFPYSGYITKILSRIDVPMLSYISYFVLGYYLDKYEIAKNKRKYIYLIGVVMLLIAIVGTSLYSCHFGKAIETLCREFSITTFLTSIALFVFVKYLFKDKEIKHEKLIAHLSNTSLGIYLTHALFRDIALNQLKISYTNIYNIPVLIIGIIAISYLFTVVIRKIPYVNKYII